MSRHGNTELRNPGSAFLGPGAGGILTLPSSCTDVGHHGATSHAGGWECCREEEIHVSAGGFSCSRSCVDSHLSPGSHRLLFAPSPAVNESSLQDPYVLIWNWELRHCKGIVQGQGQYLIIQQTGKYFIYAQLYRKETLKEPFTMMLYKNKIIPLNNAVGPENGTVNFARPFLLQKGDRLHCKKNDKKKYSLLENQTYWGLFKM
ncbi:uncharacterized protein LOC115483909 isoform X1 [Serinus canaria]|uniref:uncharacterized protein LOC115483909 isoform X1 n=1 Tax=Serinus canaria TaxID=9135 RepID=UPI0011AE757B|nr:uncharacterized protein LOC115483909 isoform X1 [Serinus canaria]